MPGECAPAGIRIHTVAVNVAIIVHITRIVVDVAEVRRASPVGIYDITMINVVDATIKIHIKRIIPTIKARRGKIKIR